MQRGWLLILFTFLLMGQIACTKFQDFKKSDSTSTSTLAYRAKTYLSSSQLLDIKVLSPSIISHAGKALIYKNLLLINEYDKGIHVFDNTFPQAPINKLFLNIPASRDFIIKDSILVVDNGNDLVSLNFKPIQNMVTTGQLIGNSFSQKIDVLSRKKDVFHFPNFPPETNVFFECPDTTQGIVIEWEKVKLSNQPNCFR